MRLLSWNLQVRIAAAAAQVEAVARLDPDVAAFEEVTVSSWVRLEPLLRSAGYAHFLTGPDQLPPGVTARLKRFVVVASKWPLAPTRTVEVPAPEVVVCATVDSPAGAFDLVAVHVPLPTREPPLNEEVQEGIARWLAATADRPRILCGDFNSPKRETDLGEVVPFARPSHKRALAAEVGLLVGRGRYGMVDVFRAVHGYGVEDRSWFFSRHGVVSGYRIDHIVASTSIGATACWYDHEARPGLSDHSPMVADLVLPELGSLA